MEDVRWKKEDGKDKNLDFFLEVSIIIRNFAIGI